MAERETEVNINGQEKKRWSKLTKALVAVTVGGLGAGLFVPLVGAVTTALVTPLWAAKGVVAGYRYFGHRG